MRFVVIALLVLLVLPVLAACATIDADNPDYQLGYQDGCESGVTYDPKFPKSVKRNKEGWEQSEMYRTGWKSGFNECRQTASGSSRNEIPGEERGYGR